MSRSSDCCSCSACCAACENRSPCSTSGCSSSLASTINASTGAASVVVASRSRASASNCAASRPGRARPMVRRVSAAHGCDDAQGTACSAARRDRASADSPATQPAAAAAETAARWCRRRRRRIRSGWRKRAGARTLRSGSRTAPRRPLQIKAGLGTEALRNRRRGQRQQFADAPQADIARALRAAPPAVTAARAAAVRAVAVAQRRVVATGGESGARQKRRALRRGCDVRSGNCSRAVSVPRPCARAASGDRRTSARLAPISSHSAAPCTAAMRCASSLSLR